MEIIFTIIRQINFMQWLWIFAVFFALHELEEWNILRWYQRNYTDLPPSTHTSVRYWIAAVILIGFAWCAVATLAGNAVFAAYVFLPAIAIAFQNALQHIYWTFLFKQYAPGLITAVVCLIPLGAFLAIDSILQQLVPVWYVGVLVVLIIPGLVQTVRAKNRMTGQIRAIHNIGIRLAGLLGKSA